MISNRKPIEAGDRVRLLRANLDTRQDAARVVLVTPFRDGAYLSLEFSNGDQMYVSERSVKPA